MKVVVGHVHRAGRSSVASYAEDDRDVTGAAEVAVTSGNAATRAHAAQPGCQDQDDPVPMVAGGVENVGLAEFF